jgi:hypothetical protein
MFSSNKNIQYETKKDKVVGNPTQKSQSQSSSSARKIYSLFETEVEAT